MMDNKLCEASMANDSDSCVVKDNSDLKTVVVEITDAKEDTEILKNDKRNRQKTTSKYAETFTRKRKRKLRYQPKNVELDRSNNEYYKNLLSTADDVDVPQALIVDEHLEACENEIHAMMTAISQNGSAKTMLQRLPRHMRRRAASHNIKRLPRRYHDLARHLGNTKTQPECRKKRRRSFANQNKLAKKTMKPQWLETHLWHAKRFHMSKVTDTRFANWDKYVPIHANDKSFRASYRSVNKHCLIQDISYMKCFKMSGPENELTEVLNLMCFTSVNLSSIQDKEIEVLLNTTDKTIIGPAKISYVQDTLVGLKHIIMWIHPVMLKETEVMLNHHQKKDILKSFQYKDISSELNRFRLIGPKSYATLLSVLRPFQPCNVDGRNIKPKIEGWMKNMTDIMNQQHMCFSNSMVTFHKHFFLENDQLSIPDNSIFSLIIIDPRLTLPLKRSKPKLDPYHTDINNSDLSNPDLLRTSPLWNYEDLCEISDSRKPDHIVSTKKHKIQLVANSQLDFENVLTAVPVVVIKFCGFHGEKLKGQESQEKRFVHSGPCNGFGAGCDIIIPKNWSTAFWVPFVYHQSRAGGLREDQNVNLQCLKPYFPEDYPDTLTGAIWWESQGNELAKVYYRKPPAKRNNYIVLGTQSPFKPNWEIVLNENSCIRDESNIKNKTNDASGVLLLSDNIHAGTKRQHDSNGEDESHAKAMKCDQQCKTVKVVRQVSLLEDLQNTWKKCFSSLSNSDAMISLDKFENDGLIPVQCLMLSKGSPCRNAMICLLTEDDYTKMSTCFTDPNKNGLQSLHGPTEKQHWKEKRKKLKEDNIAKTKSKEAINLKPLHFTVNPNRQVVGYLTSADYLYTYACGGGVGFISCNSLLAAMNNQSQNKAMSEMLNHPISRKVLVDNSCFKTPIFVLIRNPDTAQYRFAKIEVMK